MASVLSEYLQV